MKVLPTGVLYINKNNVENEEKDSLSSNNIKTESGNNNNNEYEGEQGKFYRSISCCLTMLICFSIVISILFITVVWVSTFSASLITLADSNRRNEFNKLENYFRQTLKDIENFGETAGGVLSKELQYYDLKKTEDLMFSLWKAQYLNTNGLEYFIFVVDADGIALGFSRPETPGSYGDDVFTTMVLLHPNISGPNHFYMYVCKDFFNKNYCDRGPLKSPDIVVDSSGNNVILYQMAIPYIGQKIWTPLYSDAATPGLLHMNMLYAFNTTYVNKDNAVFGYDFAATSMGIYLNESTLHLPGAVVFVIETPTGQIVASNDVMTSTSKSGKGQVGSFENGFITISFNAAIKSDNHGLKGCKTATSLTEKLPRLTEEKTKGPLPFIIHCAVVTDSVACGNLGTSEVKSFSIIGNIQKKMQEMLTKNLELDIPITISGKVQKVIKEQFTTRPIETISFCNNQCQPENINVFELGEVLHVAMDEWMYEMEQKESKNKWNNYNEGYNLYMDGKYGDASQKFKEHLLRNPNDKVGKKMLDICQ
ncbi:hypothetical protein ABK040_003786 [Willaertia magna]